MNTDRTVAFSPTTRDSNQSASREDAATSAEIRSKRRSKFLLNYAIIVAGGGVMITAGAILGMLYPQLF